MNKKLIVIFALLGLVALVSGCATGRSTYDQPYSGGGGCGRIVGLMPAAPMSIDLPGIGGGLIIVALAGIATYLLSRNVAIVKKAFTPKATFY